MLIFTQRVRKVLTLDAFRTLPSSQATGAQQIGRLTNLTQLHRGHQLVDPLPQHDQPDFGATFPDAVRV